MDVYAASLEFRGVAQSLIAQPAVGVGQALERAVIEARHFSASVSPQALQSVNSPNFRPRVNVEKRKNVSGISPGDDNQSRPAIAHNLLQEERNSGIWVRLIAVGVEGLSAFRRNQGVAPPEMRAQHFAETA